jgi:hypothetical protein
MKKQEIPAQASAGSSAGAYSSATATAPAPEPMPSVADVATAKRVVKEMFSAEIDLATTAPQQIATARHLLLAASNDRLEAPERFAMLIEALRLALAAEDVASANEVMDRLACDFTIPMFAGEATSWDAKAAILRTLSDRARTSAEHATMAGAALVFAELAARNGRLDLARSTAAMAVGEAREGGDVELFRKATLRYLEVQDGRL